MSTLSTALRGFLPWRRRTEAQASDFDAANGVDTSGVVRIASMDIASPNYLYARYYKASNAEHFTDAIRRLGIAYENYTFVDYGSGKALTLLLASHYPFRRIIGVEFGADLHRIAVRNIDNYRSPDRKCFDLESICADATEFTPPDTPLVCYFYDPFEPVVLQKVLRTLQQSYVRCPRPVIIVYYGASKASTLYAEAAERNALLVNSGFLQLVRDEEIFTVLETAEVRQERAEHA